MSRAEPRVYLEIGRQRVFAGSIEWPGWCRRGRDERSALEALAAYAPRYRRAIRAARLGFVLVERATDFTIIERLKGDSTTDFGAPGSAPTDDARPISQAELKRLHAILECLWRTFDEAVEAAWGRDLRKGPRGGGRDLGAIIDHVIEGNRAYLSKLAWKPLLDERAEPGVLLADSRQAVHEALNAAADGRVPERGPRGGKVWTARYFARRVAWHVLDHAWEIEDRTN